MVGHSHSLIHSLTAPHLPAHSSNTPSSLLLPKARLHPLRRPARASGPRHRSTCTAAESVISGDLSHKIQEDWLDRPEAPPSHTHTAFGLLFKPLADITRPTQHASPPPNTHTNHRKPRTIHIAQPKPSEPTVLFYFSCARANCPAATHHRPRGGG